MGYEHVESGPYVRSSYHEGEYGEGNKTESRMGSSVI
jgi:lipoate synthase